MYGGNNLCLGYMIEIEGNCRVALKKNEHKYRRSANVNGCKVPGAGKIMIMVYSLETLTSLRNEKTACRKRQSRKYHFCDKIRAQNVRLFNSVNCRNINGK